MSTLRFVVGATCAALALPCAGQSPDPFSPHVRWSTAAAPSAPWLPSSVGFALDGELLSVGCQGASPRVQLYATAPLVGSNPLAPSFEAVLGGAFGSVLVTSAESQGALFAATQHVLSGALQRSTEIARYDPGAAGFLPTWSATLGLVGNGAVKLAVASDATRVLGLVHDAPSQTLELVWLDGASGAITVDVSVWGQSLRGFAASRDLGRVAVIVGNELRIYEDSGLLQHAELLAAPSSALAISASGERVAHGDGSAVRWLSATPTGWVLAGEVAGAAAEVPTRLALDAEGATLAVGWWDSVASYRARLELWDLAGPTRSFVRSLGDPGSALQNFVEAVALSADGRRAAFALWGAAGAEPELVVADRDTGASLFEADLGGSARALALDARGTRIAVGFKHGHANQFGTSGEVRLYDTGERELQLVAEPRAGATLRLAAGAPGARRVLFLLGARRPSPIVFGSGAGVLWIERATAQRFSRPTDPGGRADLVLPISPAAAGFERWAQMAVRLPGGVRFGATLVHVLHY